MTTIRLKELSADAADAIKCALANNEDIFITDDQEEHLAQVVSVSKKVSQLADTPLRKGGFAKDKVIVSDDWDSQEVNDEIAREFGTLD